MEPVHKGTSLRYIAMFVVIIVAGLFYANVSGQKQFHLSPSDVLSEVASYIRPFKPKPEDEILFDRIKRLERVTIGTTYDFEYVLQDWQELVLKIEIRKDGKIDKDKSNIMNTMVRNRFSKKGLGVFRVHHKQENPNKYVWGFDLDTGSYYGVTFSEYAYKVSLSEYVVNKDSDELETKIIFHSKSDSGQSSIKITAQIISRDKDYHGSSKIVPLYE